MEKITIFYSADEFRKMIKEGKFVEWEEVYKDHLYGTLKTEIERIFQKGNHVIFDVDAQGGINLKEGSLVKRHSQYS